MLVDVAAAESGSYHCQVTNKDGSVTSNKALLTVHRVGRLQAAATASSSGAAGTQDGGSSSPVAGLQVSGLDDGQEWDER